MYCQRCQEPKFGKIHQKVTKSYKNVRAHITKFGAKKCEKDINMKKYQLRVLPALSEEKGTKIKKMAKK